MPRRMLSYEVETLSPAETAFAVYTDFEFWRHRSIFGEVRWLEGRPWQVGSRVQSELTPLDHQRIEQTVVSFIPNKRIELLSRAYGLTLESRIDFKPTPKGTTVSVTSEVSGITAFILGMTVERAFEQTTIPFLQDLCAEANRRAAA